MRNHFLFAVLISLCLLPACGGSDFTPRPKAYFRIAFPEKKYVHYTPSDCPFSFDYPVYATAAPDPDKLAEPCWINIDFGKLNGTLHLSYKRVDKNLGQYIEDAHTFITKHIVKANAMPELLVRNDSVRVFGLLTDIEGNAASPLQFYLTDSTQHFVRGALYFNARPNMDSIAPVLKFVREDVMRMISTFRWKNAR